MKIGAPEKIQNVSALLMLAFCILYSSLDHKISYAWGFIVWGSTLLFLYLPNLFTFSQLSEDGVKMWKKIFSVFSWFYLFLFLGIYTENTFITIGKIVCLILSIAIGLFYQHKMKKMEWVRGD